MKKILIVAGDPNSINSEIILKSWKNLNYKIRKKVILIGNYNLISKQKQKQLIQDVRIRIPPYHLYVSSPTMRSVLQRRAA